jgi:alkyldihydroxyacetonephosphate synthase
LEILRASISESGAHPWAGCHISHTYQSGASVYFTFGFRQQAGRVMDQYLRVKGAVQQSFIDHGATLSHHHAVGTEHLPWLASEISPLGVQAISAIKRSFDPANVMNPGRLQPSQNPFEDWKHVGNETSSVSHAEERLAIRKLEDSKT